MYSKKGFWRGKTAVTKLKEKTRLGEELIVKWLEKQPVYQIYMPRPKYVPSAKIDVKIPNSVHQVDILYLPHDQTGNTIYKYCMCVVDVASR